MVAEKTAKDARGLLYFAAPGRMIPLLERQKCVTIMCINLDTVLALDRQMELVIQHHTLHT